MKKVRELWTYREMIFSTIKKDLSASYRRSFLGTLWIFLNPLLQLLVYNIVFSEILQVGTENYFIFLAAALIPWIFFSTSVTGGARCIISSQDIVKKIYYPREITPISFVTTAFVTMLLSFVAIFIVIGFAGVGVNPVALVYLPLLMLIEYLFALGLALITAALTVYFRDMEFILGIITMAWQFLTPVMYPSDFVPEELLPIWNLNPMTPIIEGYRDIIYYQTVPSVERLVISVTIGIIGLVIGWVAFGKLQKGFAEEL